MTCVRRIRYGGREPRISILLYSSQGAKDQDALHTPLRTAFYPIDFADQAIMDLFDLIETVLTSRQTIDLSKGLDFSIQAVYDDDREKVHVRGILEWSKALRREEKWAHSDRHIFPLPYFKEWEDCCVLPAVVAGLFLNKELKQAQNWSEVMKNPQTSGWKMILGWKNKRDFNSAESLNLLIKETVRHFNLDVEIFKKRELKEIAEEMACKGLKLNLKVYHRYGGERQFYSWPEKYDASSQTIHILAASAEEQKSCGDNDLRIRSRLELDEDDEVDVVWHACGVIINPSAFFSSKGRARTCSWCNRAYTHKHFTRHKCTGLEDFRSLCPGCQRMEKHYKDYICLANRNDFCTLIENEKRTCETCERECYSKNCYKLHSSKCKSMGWLKCEKCKSRIRKGAPHSCFHLYCHHCREFYQPEGEDRHHKCFLTGALPRKSLSKLAFWDTETVFSNGIHRVNAVGLAFEKKQRGFFNEIYFYDRSMQHEENEREIEFSFSFDYLSERLKEWKNIPEPKNPHKEKLRKLAKAKTLYNMFQDEERGPLDQFLDFILHPDFDDYTFIAHYGQAFDLVLLLNLLHKRKLTCQPIFEGNKIITLSIKEFNIRFIDSHRFIPSSLDSFPKRFPHLKGVAKKGFFPYKFNKEDNYDYSGPYPSEEEYYDEYSSKKKVLEIKQFLETKKGENFNFKKELHDYLQMDIRVLTLGCCSLIKEFLDFQNELQKDEQEKKYFFCFNKPFITVPQFIHALWRTHGLKHKLYLLNNQSLARKDSYGEMEWLAWQQYLLEEEEIFIRTARTPGGQKKIEKYFLDGFCEETMQAWEFLGCFVHCHWFENPQCPLTKGFNASDLNPFGQSSEIVCKRFQKKLEFLQEQGIKTKVMWECEWNIEKEKNHRVKNYLQLWKTTNAIPEKRLAIRQALRGGRCETFKMKFIKKESEGKKLLYIDKNSLYPYVALTFPFPVDEPTFLLGNDVENNIKFENGECLDKKTGKPLLGLIQATVSPPYNMYLPILPIMDGNKLIFGLCKSCIIERKNELCSHEDHERYITDVWTLPEVAYALHCGYKLITCHEAIIYRKSAKIFEDFYALLARLKIKSEPLPIGTNNEDYTARLNSLMPWLRIEASDFKENPALRAFAKLLSNAALGKLSQYDVKKKSNYVETYNQMKKMFNDPKIKVNAVHLIHQQMAEVVFEPKDFLVGLHRNTNVIVYSHVTAYARLDMLKDMKKFRDCGYELYYTDTDSIVLELPEKDYESFKMRNNINSPAYGLYKEETKGDIEEFFSLGCKNYFIKTNKKENILKVRGFTLGTICTEKTLNGEKLKSLVNERLVGKAHIEETSQSRMKINKITGTVKNDVQVKKYSNMTFDKRFIYDKNMFTNAKGDSLPYGTKYIN